MWPPTGTAAPDSRKAVKAGSRAPSVTRRTATDRQVESLYWRRIRRPGGGSASRDAPPKAVLGRPFIGEPGSVCTETYLCRRSVQVRKRRRECLLVYLVQADALPRHRCESRRSTRRRRSYTFVPTQDLSRTVDRREALREVRADQEEIAFIEWMIRRWHQWRFVRRNCRGRR